MIAVADASPLCYLVLIGEIDLLPKLFGQVLVPYAVIAELLHPDAPEKVRAWASHLPTWICAEDKPLATTVGLEKLRSGEQAAILLAESVKADLILLDEKAARRVAADRGLGSPGSSVYWARRPLGDWLNWRPRLTALGRPASDRPRPC